MSANIVTLNFNNTPRGVIAASLPTFADHYENAERVRIPTQRELEAAADEIIDALREAGYEIEEKGKR